MNKLVGLIRKLIIIALFTATAGIASCLYYMEYKLPDTEALNRVQLQVPLQIFTKDKKLIATYGEKRRIPIPYENIPKSLVDAVLATEDQRYFQHSGVDIPGLGRAALQLIATGRKVEGGSTITMQVARSFYLSRKKTFSRKLREILLAIKIENKLRKEKILELYLNKVFLGHRAYGVGAAAQVYYGKDLKDLTLAQYAMIAGLPKAPSTLNPITNAKAAKKRRNHVLSRMHEEGYIDDANYNAAVTAPITATYHSLPTEIKAPYVAELARSQLEQMYGDSIYTDGLKVYTTVNSRLQLEADKALRDNLLAYDQRHGYRGPIKNLGTPSLSTMDDWQAQLKKLPIYNTVEPAAVIELTRNTITVLKRDGKLVVIPWSGLSWARKQIRDKYLGAKPTRASQIVSTGDVVQIVGNEADGYRLTQTPKAEASLVALNPKNGAILAMVGGFDYQRSKFNRVTHAQRQPGSSFKPFVYAAALDKGFTLSTVINDAPIVIENPTDNTLWRPQNDTHEFYGPTRLRIAIMKSRNLVSIRLLDLMGIDYATHYLHKFGFSKRQLPQGLSLALGTALVTPLQMAQGFSIFANGGMKVTPFILSSVDNLQNQSLYLAKPNLACDKDCPKEATMAPRVISKQTAFLMTSALHDVIERGTGKMAKELEREDIAGKTGTTQNQVDAWFAGYNPDIVTIAWVGYDQPKSLREYGSKAALPMWLDFMRAALKNKPDHAIQEPEGIVSIRINPDNGKRAASNDQSGIHEYFMLPYVPEKETASDQIAAQSAVNSQNPDYQPLY